MEVHGLKLEDLKLTQVLTRVVQEIHVMVSLQRILMVMVMVMGRV